MEAGIEFTAHAPRLQPEHDGLLFLAKDEARALLAVARADGPRSHALVSLLLFTGIRLSEALNASNTDYGHDTGHRTLSIWRKGGKDGKVAVPAPAVEALNAYLGTTGRELVAGTAGGGLPMFTTASGKRWASSEAFRTVQRLARVAGVEGRISPHSLRHTFARLHWTREPPYMTFRTAWAMLTPAPHVAMIGHATRW